jgi:hypothetical protein
VKKLGTVILEAYALGESAFSEPATGRFWAEVLNQCSERLIILARTPDPTALFPSAEVHVIERPLLQTWKRLKLPLGTVPQILFYLVWLIRARSLARRICLDRKVDLFVHATFGNLLIGTFFSFPRVPVVLCGGSLVPAPAGFRKYQYWGDRLRDLLVRLWPEGRSSGSQLVFFSGHTMGSRSTVGPPKWVALPDAVPAPIPASMLARQENRSGIVFLAANSKARKGTRIALEAWQRASPRRLRLVICGKPPKGIKFSESMEFLAELPRDRFLETLLSAEAVLFPSYREGLSSTLVEALQARKTMIAFSGVGMNDFLPEASHLVVEPGEDPAQSLAGALRRLDALSNPLPWEENEFTRLCLSPNAREQRIIQSLDEMLRGVHARG